jgi:hypothetical protein
MSFIMQGVQAGIIRTLKNGSMPQEIVFMQQSSRQVKLSIRNIYEA